jgi:Domain of unknown function (DUF222)/HNH endonuclease
VASTPATALRSIETHLHPDYVNGKKLGAEITELCAYIYAATYRLLVLIREFDEKELWAEPGLCSCAHWLNFKCGIGMNAAREKVRVAHALKDLPKISEGFRKGELSYSKVRAITRAATAENEDALMNLGRHGTASHVEKVVSSYRRAKRLQDVDTANEQHRDRTLDYFYDADGSLIIKGRFPAEQGALIVKALEMAMDHQFSTNDVSAETSEEHDDWDDSEQREPADARRADALSEVAETYLNNNVSSGSTGDRYQVVVHVSAETSDAHIEDGPHVSAETSRRVGCDCSVIGILENDEGEPLSIGRKSRAIPSAIRRALRFRDKGCRFPGCTNARFVDGHHVKHWADGGETNLQNLVQLCRHHHRLVHEGGFGCKRLPDGSFEFTAPSRQLLDESPPRIGMFHEQDPYDWFEREMRDLEIDSHTCESKWYAGEILDLQHAVSSLFDSPSHPY